MLIHKPQDLLSPERHAFSFLHFHIFQINGYREANKNIYETCIIIKMLCSISSF